MTRTIRERLWDIALDQYGYVTNRDAHDLAINVVELGKLAHRDQLERAGYGIYRFPQFPVSDLDPYMLATLWARRGVLSHDTALHLYDLCDVNPSKIHLTVPPAFRPRSPGGELYVVHHADLRPDQIGWHERIPTVTPRTAVEQAGGGAVPTHLARQAVDAARARVLITADEAERFANQRGQRTVR